MTMARGADGGCGTEERPCPASRVPAKIPATSPEKSPSPPSSTVVGGGGGVDFFAQAKKALCLRSPFDGPEEASPASVPTLPSGLASFLWRQSDSSRKRHKKSHSGADNIKKKKSSRQGDRSKAVSNIWVNTEEYFRDLTMSDIDKLSEVSEFTANSAARNCLLIPVVGNVKEENPNELVVKEENVDSGRESGFEVEKENGVVVKEEVKKVEKDNELMEIDSVGDEGLPLTEKNTSSDLVSSSGLEWLLGSRDKACLTTERPSKKRKLLGGDAGLEKVLVASSCDGNSSLCHFCSRGDTGKELNMLVSCSSCKVSVHRKCYGVEEAVGSTWLCSWCKRKSSDSSRDLDKPCVLCPNQGGALKPVFRSVESDGSAEFVHLFCCQWAPEVYIEDLVKMDPVMNVGAIKETRKKMVCNICKVKWGACVRCSHGMFLFLDSSFLFSGGRTGEAIKCNVYPCQYFGEYS